MFAKPTYIKRSKIEKQLDDVVSLIVRIRGHWRCIKCRRKYPPVLSRYTGLPAQNLMTTSHYFNRGKDATRWDFDNLDPICLFCHGDVEHHKTEDVGGFNYQLYMLQKLGEARFEALRVKAQGLALYEVTDLQEMLEENQKILNSLLKPKNAS